MHRIIPHVFLCSMEPVKRRISKESKTIKALFDTPIEYFLSLIIVQNLETNLFHINFNILLGREMQLERPIEGVFDDVESVEAREFVEKVLGQFLPFKRAILTFEQEEMTIEEMNQKMDVWRDGLISDMEKAAGLEEKDNMFEFSE